MKLLHLTLALLVFAHVVLATDYSKYNKRVGAKFLQEKETEEGVVKTDSGLLYKVLNRGDGESPTRKF